jgi:hypothetical protein
MHVSYIYGMRSVYNQIECKWKKSSSKTRSGKSKQRKLGYLTSDNMTFMYIDVRT